MDVDALDYGAESRCLLEFTGASSPGSQAEMLPRH